MHPEAPILEFDPAALAILNPPAVPLTEPSVQRCVLCFFQDVIDALKNEGALRQIGRLRSEIGDNQYICFSKAKPRFCWCIRRRRAAGGGFLEELIALGVNRFIACGGCGVLDQQIAAGHPLFCRRPCAMKALPTITCRPRVRSAPIPRRRQPCKPYWKKAACLS
jgi:hypothetical protein